MSFIQTNFFPLIQLLHEIIVWIDLRSYFLDNLESTILIYPIPVPNNHQKKFQRKYSILKKLKLKKIYIIYAIRAVADLDTPKFLKIFVIFFIKRRKILFFCTFHTMEQYFVSFVFI